MIRYMLIFLVLTSCSAKIDITTIKRAIDLCKDQGGLYAIDTLIVDSAICVYRDRDGKHKRIR